MLNNKNISIAVAVAICSSITFSQIHAAENEAAVYDFKTSVSSNDYRAQDSAYRLRASDIIGADVISANNEEIGEVDDMIMTKDSSDPIVVVSVGGFLGIGDKLVTMPYSNLRFSQDGDELFLDVTKEMLKAKPAFEYDSNEASGRQMLENRASAAKQKIAEGWEVAVAQWNDVKAGVKQQWNELTDDDINEINGDREVMIDRIGERYGRDRVEVEPEVDAWVKDIQQRNQ